MDLSKLNISSIAKEEIRRKFFDSRSSKNKKSDELDSSGQKHDEDLEIAEEEKTTELKQKVEQAAVPPPEVATSTSEDDSLPLITSVFSLAMSSSGTEDEGCVSNAGIRVSTDEKINTTGTFPGVVPYPTAHSSNDVPVCSQGPLPFVVKCRPNGVIAVCSPPNPTSTSCMFRPDHEESTTLTSSVKGSVCSTESSDETPKSTGQQVFQDIPTSSIPSTGSDLNPSMVTFIDATQSTVVPVEKPRSEVEKYLPTDTCETMYKNNTICSTSPYQIPNQEIPNVMTEETNEHSIMQETSVATPTTISSVMTSSLTLDLTQGKRGVANENSPPDEATLLNKTPRKPTGLSSSQQTSNDGKNKETPTQELSFQDENINQPAPTKQEEKIRQLKHLLRQKEAELEKFRFRTKSGPLPAAAQLRENFLKKNPSLCRRSQRFNLNKGAGPNKQFSTAMSGNKDTGLGTNDEMGFTSEGSETESSSEKEVCVSASKKAEEAMANVKMLTTSLKQKSTTKFNDQDKYRLVNVTILQGHTRTLAVPLAKQKGKAVSESFTSQATETKVRERKQKMPKKARTVQTKQKSSGEEDIASLKSFTQSTATDSLEYGKRHCPNAPNTRTSPRKRQRSQPPQYNPLKRKHPSIKKENTQDEPSVPKKVKTVGSAPKTIAKVLSPSSKVTASLKQLATSKPGQSSVVSLITAKTGSTIPKEDGSIKLTTGTIALTDKHTTQTTASLLRSNTSITQPSASLTSSATSATQLGTLAASSTTTYILHMTKAGAATETKTKCASNEEIMKNIVDSSKKQVFALVGKVPEIDITNSNKGVFDPVKTGSAGVKVIAQSNLVVTSNKSSPESKVNPTSTTNISGNLGRKTVVSPITSNAPIPIFSNPMMNIQQTKLRKELAKLGLLTNISSTNDTNQSKVVAPVIMGPVNCQTAGKGPLIQVLTQKHEENTVPILASSTNSQARTTSPESVKCENTRLPATTVSSYTNQTSTVSTSTNGQADDKNNTRSSSTNLLAVVNTVAPLVTNKPTSIATRPLAPKPKLQLNALTIPVPTENSVPNMKSVHHSLSKSVANANPVSRTLAPKIAIAVPQYTLPRPLAPKPTATQYTSPSHILPKPTASLLTASKRILHKPTVLQSTTTPLSLSLKSSTPQLTSPQTITKPLSSQRTTPSSIASEPTDKVIFTLPKPVMAVSTAGSSTLPENLNNGSILVYDVVQSNPPTGGQNPPLGGNNAAKLVMYVSNSGETRHLGIIKDNKIYLNSNQVSVVASKPESPVKASPSEFIPNSGDAEFKTLLGLEHVVHLLT